MASKVRAVGVALLCLYATVEAVANSHPSSYEGFHPHSRYYRVDDQTAEASERVENTLEKFDSSVESSNSIGGSPEQRTQRFGITAYGGSGVQGAYPSAGGGPPSIYGPMKIDLGGVLLGSLIGLGAVLILPKLVSAFSYSYGGGYGRSVETDVSSFTALLTKLDETLERNNVDSSSCVQRVACSYVQSALDNMAVGNATDVDSFISTISDNSLISYMLDGTAMKQALEAGKDINTDCQSLYSRCKLDKQTVMKVLSNVIPS